MLAGCWWTRPATAVKDDARIAAKDAKAEAASAGKVRPECVDIARSFETALSPLVDDSPVENIAAIRKAESEAGEDTPGCLKNRVALLYRREREKLVRLSVGGENAPASAIHACSKLDDGLLCGEASRAATDALLAATRDRALFKPDQAVRVNLLDSYRPGDVRVYQLLAADAEPVPVERASDGSLKLDGFTDGQRVLFAIVREPAGVLKYVWVVRAGS